jgi:hypothetical protein
LDVQTAPNSEAAKQEPPAKGSTRSAFGWTLLFFAIIWATFYGLFRGLPYLKNGSDLAFTAKLQWEQHGQVFPADPQVTRVLIFGNSKVMAGFVPDWFDQLSSASHLRVSSFNSGFPGSDLFLPPLKAMCARGQSPNVLLLTLPWDPDQPPRDLFHFLRDDHASIERLFPFRYFIRDLTAFLLAAPGHGGMVNYYRQSEATVRQVIADRGYHLITEQSRFPGAHLPDDFHLGSDEPAKVIPRITPAKSAQIGELNQLIRRYHIDCYYVPIYLRRGEAAPAAEQDASFAGQVEKATPCKVLGPDYYLYPNRLFADQTHLNEAGAQVYTQALFQLLKDRLTPHALQ